MNIDDIQRDSYGGPTDSAGDNIEKLDEKLSKLLKKIDIFGDYSFPIQVVTIFASVAVGILSIVVGEATKFNEIDK